MTQNPLLTTKLFSPPVRPERVKRERLLARLDGLLRPGLRLGLISAPAGFGKTSLLAEWLVNRELPAAWLALDAGDNDPSGFLSYLLAAIQRARPGSIPQTTAMLNAALSGAEPPLPQAILAGLVNELSTFDPSQLLVIALDDFQFVTSADVREATAFLVEHLPPVARLVIATRSDPPLSLARLRARGQMVELRAADLRFTNEEAALFLQQSLGQMPGQWPGKEGSSPSAPDLLVTLAERTEGWAAGLQMAALAIQSGEQGAEEIIRSFSGSHHFILDYLAEEVLARLPAETVNFLLRTALLDRFNAELCQAVAQSGPANEGQPSNTADFQARLEAMERANLFLVPLDGERRWFRFHHLFADLLKARLKQSDPGSIPDLHRRAARWFEQNGLIGEAIQHTLAAAVAASASTAAGSAAPDQAEEDYQHAAQLVETHTLALFRRGELHAMQRWVNRLPDALTLTRPRLSIYRAWVLVFTGRIDAVEPLLRQAETSLPNLPESEQRDMLVNCAAIRCHRELITGRPAQVIDLARQAADLLPDEGTWLHGFLDWNVAYASRSLGDLETAGRLFERGLRHDQAANDPWGTANNGNDLGVVRRLQGRLRESIEILQSALLTVEQNGARGLGYTGRLLTGLAVSFYEQNALETAERYLDESIMLNERWHNPNHRVYSALALAKIYTAQAKYELAEAQINTCDSVLRDWPVLRLLQRSVEAARLLLQLAQGRVPGSGGITSVDGSLSPKADEIETLIQSTLQMSTEELPFDESREIQQILVTRLLLAQRRLDPALMLLKHLEDQARAGGRGMVLIDLLTMKALVLFTQGQREPAETALAETALAESALREALERAEPEGVQRSILDNAPLAPGVLRTLLRVIRQQPGNLSAAYIDRLLTALPEPETIPAQSATSQADLPSAKASASSPAASTSHVLYETPTGREMEVLHLIAAGLTNAQIAARLVISTGTVKAHTASIFRKLDAENRTQAVSHARELGLLP